ncbi:hypothetical protein D3C84_724460 [compost metagenome]
MAEGVVDLLEVVDIDHRKIMIVFTGGGLQLLIGAGHERAAIGDFREGVDVGPFQQQLGHDVVIELGLAQGEEAVDGQCTDECRVTERQHSTQFSRFDACVVKGVEKQPGDDLCGEE